MGFRALPSQRAGTLTGPSLRPYTYLVRRLQAAVVVVAVILFGTQAAALHVHAYVDHDHTEHHHGPDAHDHEIATESDEPAHVSSCDPSAHLISVSYTACPGSDVSPDGVALVEVAVAAETSAVARAVEPLDTRGHGPPGTRCNSLRAPPPQTFL